MFFSHLKQIKGFDATSNIHSGTIIGNKSFIGPKTVEGNKKSVIIRLWET